MSEPRRHLGAGAALSVVAQSAPLLAGAVLSVVLARTIGPSGNGRYVLLLTLVGLASMIVSLGLHAGITYEVSRRRWSVARAYRTSFRMALALGLVGSLAGFGFFLLTQDTVFGGIPSWLALLALASVPLTLAYEYAASILLARERYEGYTSLLAVHAATLALIGAGLALPFGLKGAVVGIPASALIGTMLAAKLLADESSRDSTADGPEPLSRALRFGLQSWGANLLQQVNYRFDVLILGGFATAADVGVYSVALTLTSIAWILPQALQTVLFPRAASLDESAVTGDLSSVESDEAVARAIRHGVLLSLPAGLAVAVLLLVGVPLVYGHRFHETVPLGFVLLPGVLLLGVGKIVGSAVTGRGQPRYALYGAGIGLPLTLGLYLGLIPAFDAWGAAIASSLSYAATAIVGVFFFRRVTAIGLREAFVPTRHDLADYRFAAALARTRFGRGR
jgi:O-antigen/teichoic acid export membrane protein